MAQPKSQPSHVLPIWGVFLLFLGLVFLLQNLKILPWGVWGTLWRFWPVVIVAAGLGIVLRQRNPWLVSGLILLIFLGCLGIATWQFQSLPASLPGTKNYTAPLGGLASARVEIDFNAGSMKVGSLSSTSTNLAEAETESDEGNGIKAMLQTQGSAATLLLTTEQANRQFWTETRWNIGLSRRIPLTLDISSAVGDLNLDLSELSITGLQMALNAGNCIVKMPVPAGIAGVSINANLANLEMTIPDGAAVRIKAVGNLSNLEVNTSRFPKKGDYYVSDGFSSAQKRIEIELNCNLGKVAVK